MTKVSKAELLNVSPNSKKMREYKLSLSYLTPKQSEAAIGLMLGDASLQSQNKGKTYRLKFEWGNRNLSYVKHVFNLFDEWVISQPHKKERISPKGNTVINWGFQTISHQAFNKLATLFIINGKKGIITNLIKDYLTPVGLAYWFMDDGGKLDYNPGSKNKSIVLNTQSFTFEEVTIMCQELNDKFYLGCEVRSNKNKWVIVVTNYSQFLLLTNDYIIQDMMYKLPK